MKKLFGLMEEHEDMGTSVFSLIDARSRMEDASLPQDLKSHFIAHDLLETEEFSLVIQITCCF